MRVVWTAHARARLRQLYDYIAQKQPLNAEGVVDRITVRAKQLTEQPHSGREVPKYDRDNCSVAIPELDADPVLSR